MAKQSDIQQVIQAAEAAMGAVVQFLAESNRPTCEAAHQLIDKVLDRHNCESPEGHIVAVGSQAVEPHEIGHGVIAEDELVVIDIYPRSKTTGYWADITRTVSKVTPSIKALALHEAVRDAQEVACSMVAPGVRGADIHNAVVAHFDSLGYKTYGVGKEFQYAEGFVHALGHGVNKNIHASPKLSYKSNDVLQVGDIITVEPGLYYKK